MSSLTLEPIFGSTWISLLILAATGSALLLVRPGGREVTQARSRRLMLLRVAALALLTLAFLRPTWVRVDARPAAANVAVLIDASRSMELADERNSSRWQTEQRLLEQLVPALADVDEHLQVQYHAYGNTARSLTAEQVETLFRSGPTQSRTDLAAALRASLTGAAGQPLAAVILIGDGTSTVEESNPGAVARTLQSLDVPLWSIPIGPRGGSDSRDLAVEQLPQEFRVFSQNTFRVAAVAAIRGMAGKDVPVSIQLIDEQGRRNEVASRTLLAQSANDQLPIDVELTAPAPGNYRLEVSIPAQVGEALTDNNTQVAFLDVREGGGRVLYLEGQPRYEQKFLRRAITDSPDLSLDYRWIDVGSQPRWPADLSEAMRQGRYDVYIIGDLDSAALGDATMRTMARNVELGAGLLMIGGLHSFDVGGFGRSPLEQVLPIEMDPSLRRQVGVEPPPEATLQGAIQVRPRAPHPITQLSHTGNNQEAWGKLKPLIGATKFAGVKVSPTVAVLLESPDQQPLMVSGQYGEGRVVAFAGDSTWQWWMQGQDEAHRRFWRQVILWLLARDAPDTDAIWIKLDSRRFDRDRPASFSSGIRAVAEDLTDVELYAEVITSEGNRIAVPTRPVAPGDAAAAEEAMIAGTLPDLPGGIHRLRVAPSKPSSSFDAEEIVFQVLDVDVELSRPLAEISRLEQLAAITENAGGKTYRADEVEQLIADIQSLRQRAELPVVEKMRLADDPWSGWLLMLAMTGLLSTEWYFRRVWGMA